MRNSKLKSIKSTNVGCSVGENGSAGESNGSVESIKNEDHIHITYQMQQFYQCNERHFIHHNVDRLAMLKNVL